MVCGAEAAVLCVSSGGGGAARGRPAHRGGAALACVATTSKGKRTETRFRWSGRLYSVSAAAGALFNHPNVRNLPNIQRSGNRGTPMVPGSTAGHATGSQMVQLGSSRRGTLYSVA